MAKKQTRRSISVRGVTYVRLREHCADHSISISDFVEQRIAEYFAAGVRSPAAVLTVAGAHKPAERTVPAAERVAAVKTTTRSTEKATQPAERPPAPTARVAPSPPARPLPAISTLHRPQPVAARRSVAAAVAPVERSAASMTGRPAPTPAAQVVKPRPSAAPRDVKDYRALRF